MKKSNIIFEMFKLLGFILLLPISLFKTIKKSVFLIRRLKRSVQTNIVCSNCQHTIPLTGMWQCTCGFQYTGHILKVCPLCQNVPNLIRCPECGVTKLI